MSEILLTALSAAICGAEGWQDVEDFGKMKKDYLKRLLPYKNGIPSDDTFRRFFRGLDVEQFKELFRKWVQTIQSLVQDRVIAIDGKAVRHSFDEETSMLHMVSAFCTEERLVLAQEKVGQKTNEITVIPKLLEWLDLRGSTVTIDAMGCQYAIANQILKQQGQYIFSLKGNQGNLKETVTDYFLDESIRIKLPVHEDWEKGHGRIELRRCFVASDIGWIREIYPEWSSIRSIVQIDSTRKLKTKTTTETRYYS
jgi:predicted transposase YbfD/YdcC